MTALLVAIQTCNILFTRYPTDTIGMYLNCQTHICNCLICQQAKVSPQISPGKLQPLSIPMYPFEEVTLDLISYLPTVSSGYDSVCTVVDRLLKYVYFVPYAEMISAEGLYQLFFHSIIARHVMPHIIIYDCDPRFASRFWSALVSALG